MYARTLTLAVALALAACDRSPGAETPSAQNFVRAGAATNPVEEGERIARILGCMGCHENNLQGDIWDDDPDFAVIAPANLTRSAVRHSDAELERMIRFGIRPDGLDLWDMPSEAYTHLSDADLKALLTFIRSLPPSGPERPRPVFGAGATRERQTGQYLSARQKVAKERNLEPRPAGPSHERGRYVARLACGECHGPQLLGNNEPFRPDLLVASGYSLDEFKRLLRTGQPTGGRTLELMARVADSRFRHLTDEEVEALHRYLLARAELAPQAGE